MKIFLLIAIIFTTAAAHAQIKDSLIFHTDKSSGKPWTSLSKSLAKISVKKQHFKSLILPMSLITYGFISLESDGLKSIDNRIKEEVWMNHPHPPVKIDNYLQYVPAFTVYGLNMAGIKGKNNFRDRTMIYLIANTVMGVTVQSLKAITKIPRPDGYGTNAFPSGHTATAFVAAEFLRQEYKDISPWYGIIGYAMGITTAYLRIYNNRHWFSDLLPGVGIGILSTKITYWIYPSIKKKLFKNKSMNTLLMPYYQNQITGISFVHIFR